MHRQALAAVLVLTVVAAGCGGGDDGRGDAAGAAGESSTSTTHDHNTMEASERGEEPFSVDPDDRCDMGFNTAEFNQTATQVEALHEHSMAMQAGEVDFTVQE